MNGSEFWAAKNGWNMWYYGVTIRMDKIRNEFNTESLRVAPVKEFIIIYVSL